MHPAGAAPSPEPPGLPGADVSGAFDVSRLHILYQPIVHATDRTLRACEVLARLDHPTLGTLFPAQFVPQIEQAGLGRRLTRAVVELALADHQTHLAALHVPLALNFPLDVLMRHGFADRLGQLCASHSMGAAQFIIEVTESQPIADLDVERRAALRDAMAGLRARGYRIALDDFGPDMPRRQELLALQFDIVKLDKAMVNDPGQQASVEQAMRAARQRGFRVVAEGIEQQATWDRMHRLEVDDVQGFFIAPPLPRAELTDWIARWRCEHRG